MADTPQRPEDRREAERLSRHLTMGANEPAAPASLLQVGGAGRVVWKKSLKLWERLWEPKIATLVNVHEHGRTLALVAVGHNRIGKEFTFTPTHGSWLNLIEGFFSKLARSVLRHIRVASKQELKDRIMAAMDFFNREPVVHTWTYKLDRVV